MQGSYGTSGQRELLERVGDIRQLAGFQRATLSDGKGKGTEVIYVRSGSGINFYITLDRGFDIQQLEYNGIPISWQSQTGPVAPAFYDKDGDEWNRSFEGGMLVTCGLTTMGKPSVDQGKAFGQHGRISSTPAELVQAEGRWADERYELVFRGRVREAKALEEHVVLHRTITARLGEPRLTIVDEISNLAFQPVEHLVLYHFNWGFPLIGETCRIELPEGDRTWIKGEGEEGSWNRFGPPSAEALPTVLAHEPKPAGVDNGLVTVAISNRISHNGASKQLTARLRYPLLSCPYVTQWKHERRGAYVLGIEPGNATTIGRGVHREQGTLPLLQPGETKRYEFELEFELKEERT